MINISPHGYNVFTKAITETARTIHLYTENGELTGHGYKPQPVIPSQWTDGSYPEVLWEFTADDAVDVHGYFVSNEGGLLFNEEFSSKGEQTPMTIKNTGDRIAVVMRLNMLGSK